MAKKMTGENPVDEAYLRSLMAGMPVEPPATAPVKTETANIAADETEVPPETDASDEKPLPKSLKTTHRHQPEPVYQGRGGRPLRRA